MDLRKTLNLDAQQSALLLRHGIDVTIPNSVYAVDGSNLDKSLNITAYLCGQIMFFLDGTSDQHVLFWKLAYETKLKPELKFFDLGLSGYGSPVSRFLKEESSVIIDLQTTNNSNTDYSYNIS